jgi:formylmethanofuran dehydrogenase subunit E
MKKSKKRKYFYCKVCTGKFTRDLVKKVNGHYICVFCAAVEEYSKDKSLSCCPLK